MNIGQSKNESPLTRCDDCGAEVPQDDLEKSLYEIDSLEDRLDAGSEVPAGECGCGAFAYLVRPGNPAIHERIERLRSAVERDDSEGAMIEARHIVVSLAPRAMDAV